MKSIAWNCKPTMREETGVDGSSRTVYYANFGVSVDGNPCEARGAYVAIYRKADDPPLSDEVKQAAWCALAEGCVEMACEMADGRVPSFDGPVEIGKHGNILR